MPLQKCVVWLGLSHSMTALAGAYLISQIPLLVDRPVQSYQREIPHHTPRPQDTDTKMSPLTSLLLPAYIDSIGTYLGCTFQSKHHGTARLCSLPPPLSLSFLIPSGDLRKVLCPLLGTLAAQETKSLGCWTRAPRKNTTG